jgi:hypothetical protein
MAAMTDNLGADLDELLVQARQRSVIDGLGRRQVTRARLSRFRAPGRFRNPQGENTFTGFTTREREEGRDRRVRTCAARKERTLVLKKFDPSHAQQGPKPPAPKPGVSPDNVPPLPPPDIPDPDPAPPPVENLGDVPLPPITDPDVIEPGEPNPTHTPMRVRGALADPSTADGVTQVHPSMILSLKTGEQLWRALNL